MRMKIEMEKSQLCRVCFVVVGLSAKQNEKKLKQAKHKPE